MSFYQFELLDPRPTEEARHHNEEIFSGTVFGIEVTVPALAERCIFNIDPQHGDLLSNRAAIEDAVSCPLPLEGSTLVTIRPDLDSVGSMAVLESRARGISLRDTSGRIALIAKADRFERAGEWPGVTEFPSRKKLWPDERTHILAPIAACVGDHSVSDF